MTAAAIPLRSHKPADPLVHDALRGRIIDAYLRRRVDSFRTVATVSVSFKTALEAEEFLRFLNRTKKGM
jgi:hypothetical protein